MSEKNYFEILNGINVNDKTEKKNGLTYLSWAWALAEVLKVCPDMTFDVKKFDGLPYVYDEKTGYMVYTEVTVGGITREMWLPVMDGANKAMMQDAYTYKDRWGKEKMVDAATMFDINKTIMRCLTKNLAMFGLGLYIYAGEDLPEEPEKKDPQADMPPEERIDGTKKIEAAHIAHIKSQLREINRDLESYLSYKGIESINGITIEHFTNVIKPDLEDLVKKHKKMLKEGAKK